MLTPTLPRRATRALALILLAMPLTAAAQAEDWWRHVTVLAHDSMAGRQTGSAEHRKAAEYVAARFRDAGLAPAGTQGYLQPVGFVMRSLDESRSRVELVRDGQTRTLTLGEDVSFVLRAPLAPRAEGRVVFAGYGLHLPELGHDDLAGLDLDGAIVAYATGFPRGLPGTVVSHARSQAWEHFRARGAVGTLTFAGSVADDNPFLLTARNRLSPQMTLADTSLDSQRGNGVSLSFNAARAELLFAGAPVRYTEVAALAAQGLPLERFALPVRLRSTAQTVESRIESDNVAGVLPGTDPALRSEYVVLTAHLDHLGIGAPVNGDSIYNGAMDNAAGVALLIETARALRAAGTQLRRSVVFLAVTAEEKGLLGSRYFANHPTVSGGTMVANLNTDMFMPFFPARSIFANGLEESDLATQAHAAGAATGIRVITDPEPEENRFVRSDQYSFILRGVPALSLKVGFERDSREHDIIRRFRAERYHRPADDLAQPVDRQAVADFQRFYLALVEQVANRATRPAWFDTSYFRRLERGR